MIPTSEFTGTVKASETSKYFERETAHSNGDTLYRIKRLDSDLCGRLVPRNHIPALWVKAASTQSDHEYLHAYIGSYSLLLSRSVIRAAS